MIKLRLTTLFKIDRLESMVTIFKGLARKCWRAFLSENQFTAEKMFYLKFSAGDRLVKINAIIIC